jgi:hypothetical protein
MIPYFIVAIIIISFSALVSFFWVRGIDHMQKNHPDYTGDDLFGEFDENDKNQIGNG